MQVKTDYFGKLFDPKSPYHGTHLQYIPVDIRKEYLKKPFIDPKLKNQIKDSLVNEQPRFTNRPDTIVINPVKTIKKTKKTVKTQSKENGEFIEPLAYAKDIALKIMKDNPFLNLIEKGWSFDFDNAKARAGVCKNRYKLISVSKNVIPNHDKNFAYNTVTHEIAHAIDVELRGYSNHDVKWQKIHVELGGNGERTYKANIDKANYSYKAICPKHGVIGGWYRKPSNDRRLCKKCRSVIEIVKA